MRIYRQIAITVSTAATLGCALPQHSNTLLFATNTAVAIDISANATTAAPNITIGYKRQEMAWVPLLANKTDPSGRALAADCPPAATTTAADPCVYQGRGGEDSDAYSVLATFAGTSGASGTGGAGGPSTSAKGSIAQFFATGLAARALAEKGGAQLVNTSITQNAETITNQWRKEEQTDDQRLSAYFGDATKTFAQLRDSLIDNSQWKGTPTGAALGQQADSVSLLNYARINFVTHSLAAALPAKTATPAPVAGAAASASGAK